MKRLLGTLAFLALAACASGPTKYGPALKSADMGYREQRLEQERFRVTFRANPDLKGPQVEDMALRRAAELTTQNGYEWFTVVTRNTYLAGGSYTPRRPHHRHRRFNRLLRLRPRRWPRLQLRRRRPPVRVDARNPDGQRPKALRPQRLRRPHRARADDVARKVVIAHAETDPHLTSPFQGEGRCCANLPRIEGRRCNTGPSP